MAKFAPIGESVKEIILRKAREWNEVFSSVQYGLCSPDECWVCAYFWQQVRYRLPQGKFEYDCPVEGYDRWIVGNWIDNEGNEREWKEK